MTLRSILLAGLAGFAVSGAAVADDDEQVRPSDYINNAPDTAWRSVDPENLLVMDLPAGPVVIELRPDFAPNHVERVRTLVRDGFYDGLKFHRVIEGFVAQGGDPRGDGTGGSELPNIAGEFTRDTSNVEGFTPIGRDRIAARVGFIDGMPAAAQPESLRDFKIDREVLIWGLHCPGVMSMARSTSPDSANSQFFLMLGDSRLDLDRRYTTWGMIVDGSENSRRIARGEPPERPTPIIRARIGSDIPEAQRPNVEVFRTETEAFQKYVEASGQVKEGLVRDICAVRAPRRINGKVEL